jgi:non-lysosomal glucosylceramidase
VATSLAALREQTECFRKTFYDSTLPNWLLDCLTSQAAIIRHIGVVFRIANGDIYGWEGSNGCCQPTCTHVWGYEQTLSRLFPDLEKEMRRIDFHHQQRHDGGVNNRADIPSPARPTGERPFTDGHASCILNAYREALNHPDDSWLKAYWPQVKRAVEYLIARDAAGSGGVPDGILQDDQWSTYDEALHGVTSFLSGYYLAALRAGEAWAWRVGDLAAALRFQAIFEKGQENIQKLCWNGEYFEQKLDDYRERKGEVGPGCMSDQLIGQWWAHQLGLGCQLPRERVQSSLRAIFRHNWKPDLTGWKHAPRAFAGAGDKGLIICTWPKGGRPDDVMLYSDEVWTRIEYQVAAHMIYEGMVEEGMAIIKGARDRYDGINRPPIPRNPWNEIECGGHCARTMSSWSILLALSGYEYDGPSGVLRFAPRLKPERFKSFFCGPEGWGSLQQSRDENGQRSTSAVVAGRCAVSQVLLVAQEPPRTARVTLGDAALEAKLQPDGNQMRIILATPQVVKAKEALSVVLA